MAAYQPSRGPALASAKEGSRNPSLRWIRPGVTVPGVSSCNAQGGVSNGDHRSDDERTALVERADPGSMAGLVGRLVRVDAGRLRLHRVPADHGADLQGVRGLPDASDRGAHRDPVDAPGGSVRLRLAGRSGRAPGALDDLHRLVLDL